MLEVTRVNDFAPLAEEWNPLLRASRSATIFLTFEWQSTWWQHLSGEAELYLLALRDGSQLVGIAPLMRRADVLRLVGSGEVSDYLDIIAALDREREVWTATLAYLAHHDWGTIDLRCLRTSSPTRTILPALAGEGELGFLEEVEEVCPRLRLPKDWESYIASLSKADRHELRRKMRRLDHHGGARWYAINCRSDLLAAMEDFLRLHRLSRQEKAFFMDERMAGFFQAIAARLRPQGYLKLYFMELDGQRISAALCFAYGDEVYLYNSGFDPRYGALSVGLLLKAFCLRDALESGARTFDFLRGSEHYKYDLGAVDEPIYRLQIFRNREATVP